MVIAKFLFCLLVLLQAVIVGLLLSGYHIVEPALYARVRATGSLETLDVAAQLGRFDIVSMFLGIIAVLLGVMAVSGFWMIRGAAVKAAEESGAAAGIDVANTEAKKVAELIAQGYLAENVPKMVESMVKSILDTAPTPQPDVGLTPEQVRDVTADAQEIGPKQIG